jgi:hypothetical protein
LANSRGKIGEVFELNSASQRPLCGLSKLASQRAALVEGGFTLRESAMPAGGLYEALVLNTT